MTSSSAADPKLLDLAETIAEFLKGRGQELSLPLVETMAVGILLRLREFTTQHAPAGDIGRHDDRRIARAIGWTGFGGNEDASWIIEQLIAHKILARDETHRLIVCDWPEQCEASCHQFVADQGIRFADGTASTRRPRQNSPVGRAERAEQMAREAALERPRPVQPPCEQNRVNNRNQPPAGGVATPAAASDTSFAPRYVPDRTEAEAKRDSELFQATLDRLALRNNAAGGINGTDRSNGS